jgi:3-phosphoshikimate 1-carboxyvinyltransferase
MGAQIQLEQNEFAPVQILGRSRLQPIHYELPIASAQIKSALLLAGLSGEGETLLTGKVQSRDHTERLFGHFGVKLTQTSDKISITGGQTLRAADVTVPADISSAAFWIIAALIVPGTTLELENISLNPTRTGILSVLTRMGAKIDTEITSHTPEPVGRICVRSSQLLATHIQADEIPSLIDELPLLAVLATFAEGTTRVEGAEELRSKETDRIEAVAINLRAMGAQIDTFPDGFSIQGPQPLHGARIQSWDDHRIAMAFSIAALQANGPTEISDPECVGISYPTFYETLREIVKS